MTFRTPACRVGTRANHLFGGAESVHTSVNATRKSACATMFVRARQRDPSDHEAMMRMRYVYRAP